MKNIFNLSLIIAAVFLISGCDKKQEEKVEAKQEKVAEAKPAQPAKKDISSIDAVKECSVKTHGIDKVLATAKEQNAEAIKRGLEFRRLGVNNSALITSIEEGMKAGAKEVNPKDFKGKTSKTKLEINYATQRACMFAIRALQQADEAKTAWRLAVPGDGFKY